MLLLFITEDRMASEPDRFWALYDERKNKGKFNGHSVLNVNMPFY